MTGRGPEYNAPPADVAELDAKLMAKEIKINEKYLSRIKEVKETLKKRYRKCQPNDAKVSGCSDDTYFPAFPHVLDLTQASLIIVGGGKYIEMTICKYSSYYSIRVQSNQYIGCSTNNLNEAIKFIDKYMYGKTW